jgi:hypothetical protein
VAYVRKSKIAAHKGEKFEFLLDALSNPNFDPNKEYTISELIELADPAGTNLRGIGQSLNRESVRDAIITLALSMGYLLRIEKTRLKGETKAKLRFRFTPLQTGDNSRLRAILKSRGIEPDSDDDDPEPPPTPTPPSTPPTPPTESTKTHQPQDKTEPTPAHKPPTTQASANDMPTEEELIAFIDNAMAEHDRLNASPSQKIAYLYQFRERFEKELAELGMHKVIYYIRKKILVLEAAVNLENHKQKQIWKT